MFDLSDMIARSSPLVQRLGPAKRKRLEYLVEEFIADVHFEGRGGAVVSPELAVNIATQACFLLLNRTGSDFGKGVRIIIHADGIPGAPDLMGRYSRLGQIDLNLPDILRGAFLANDGCNIVMHEFAHRLDGENFFMDGNPAHHSSACYAKWKRIMEDAYERFKFDVEAHLLTPLNPYGATNSAEFFACATEAFFETPDMLARYYPDVHEQLAHFYGTA